MMIPTVMCANLLNVQKKKRASHFNRKENEQRRFEWTVSAVMNVFAWFRKVFKTL